MKTNTLSKASLRVRYKPAVNRHWLWLVAGLMWSAVGIMLCAFAGHWLARMDWRHIAIGAGTGLTLGLVIYRFGFSRIARKNISRIAAKSNPACFFAFQAWRSYLLIAIMISLGITLRHSALPRLYLAIIYSAIGTGLACSSTLYYQELLAYLASAA